MKIEMPVLAHRNNLRKTRFLIAVVAAGMNALTLSICPAEDVSLNSYPVMPSAGVRQVVNGSLTQARAALTNPLGQHNDSTISSITAMPDTKEWKCFPVQVKAKIDDADVKISLSWTSEILLPIWNNRTSTCASATAEWNSFAQRVESHEIGHHSTSKNYCVNSIIIPGYFTGVDSGGESSWVGPFQYGTAKINAQNQVRTKAILKANAISAYLEGPLVDYYHSQVGGSVSLPSTTAECPQ